MHAQRTGEGVGAQKHQQRLGGGHAMQVEKVSVIDHPQLQDGMRTHWSDAAMVDHMEAAWAQASYDLVRASSDSNPRHVKTAVDGNSYPRRTASPWAVNQSEVGHAVGLRWLTYSVRVHPHGRHPTASSERVVKTHARE
jgi:hypothetical protein